MTATVMPRSHGARAALPQMRDDLQVFADDVHFIEEHRPEEIADAIARLFARADNEQPST